ncbi:hypothetical protein [Mycolicibacterium sp. XJ870]
MTNFSNWPGPDPTRGTPPPRFNQPAPHPGFGGPSAPPAKNRKPLFITAGATVAVLTVIAVIVAFLMSRGEDGASFNPSGSPTDVAKAYMDALAGGDAQAALDLSATEPATTELLTDDILKMQLEKLPITEVEVVGEEKEPDADEKTSAVKVTAKFGGERTEGKLDMVVVDNEWKMSAAFVNATTEDVHGFGDAKVDAALTVLGKPLPQSRHIYVFPGYIQMDSTTPYLNINDLPPTTLDDVTARKDTTVEPKFSMTDEGLKAAQDALRAWIDKCFNPGDKPDECGGIGSGSWTNSYDMSTLRVRGPVDLPADLFRLADHTSVVQVGSLRVPITAAEKGSGRVIDNFISISDQVEVNIGEQPPRVSLNR